MIKAEEYKEFIISSLKEIMAVDSPTGFSGAVNRKLEEMLKEIDRKSVV